MVRPSLHEKRMVRRTYQLTDEQDQAIKRLSNTTGASHSHIVRVCIQTKLIDRSIDEQLKEIEV